MKIGKSTRVGKYVRIVLPKKGEGDFMNIKLFIGLLSVGILVGIGAMILVWDKQALIIDRAPWMDLLVKVFQK